MRLFTTLAALLGIGSGSSDAEATVAKHEEAVIVHFDYGQKDWSRIFEFEESLEEALAQAAVGEYDGNELATDGSDGSMYMYGPNADALFAIVEPRLVSATFLRNIVVTLRYGAATDPAARERKIKLGPLKRIMAESGARHATRRRSWPRQLGTNFDRRGPPCKREGRDGRRKDVESAAGARFHGRPHDPRSDHSRGDTCPAHAAVGPRLR